MIEIYAALIQSVVSVVAVSLAYLFGKAQGKYQTQHNESAKVVIELRRLALEAAELFEERADKLLSPATTRDEEREANWQLGSKISELLLYYQAYSPWLKPRTAEKLNDIINEVNSKPSL
jgi:urease accessory protein UreF